MTHNITLIPQKGGDYYELLGQQRQDGEQHGWPGAGRPGPGGAELPGHRLALLHLLQPRHQLRLHPAPGHSQRS